jgi:hypothetical protein
VRILHTHSNHAVRQRAPVWFAAHVSRDCKLWRLTSSALVIMPAEPAIHGWAPARLSLTPRETNSPAPISAIDTPTVIHGRANLSS